MKKKKIAFSQNKPKQIMKVTKYQIKIVFYDFFKNVNIKYGNEKKKRIWPEVLTLRSDISKLAQPILINPSVLRHSKNGLLDSAEKLLTENFFHMRCIVHTLFNCAYQNEFMNFV